MRISSRSKAVALLLLVSCQYSFAMVDVALCSTALCYPKVTGQKWGDVKKVCPPGYDLTTDLLGKAVCSKTVTSDCPAGTTLKDGQCCGSIGVKQCDHQIGGSCPEGTKEVKDCAMPTHPLMGGARKLQSDHPLFREINIAGTNIVPNVILPKPAISLNMAAPKPVAQPKINIPSHQMPQIILPEPPITFTMPTISKIGPEIKFEGSPNIIPQIIPVLPEPHITVEVPKDAFPGAPKINTDFAQKKVTLDFSKVGPSHTVDINVPAMPDMIGEHMKLPDINVTLPDGPKVLDFSHLGPKTTLDVKLPNITLPKQGSLTIINAGANEPQYLDLTGLGGKKDNKTQYNIVLPSVKTNGAVLNVVLDHDKDIPSEIVFPGKGGMHNTVVNVPAYEKTPEKKATLVVDVQANSELHKMFEDMSTKKVNTTKISVQMPAIDLSKKLPAGPDVVVELKPLFKFNHSALDFHKMAGDSSTLKKVDIKLKDIEIGRLVNDTTVVIKPLPMFNLSSLMAKLHKDDLMALGKNDSKTETVINLPTSILPKLYVPKGKTDIAVTVPVKLGLLKGTNTSDPDAVVSVYYKEEWVNATEGADILPNPGAIIANKLGAAVNAVTTLACPTKCCKEDALIEKCFPAATTTDTVPVKYECDSGCTYDLKQDKCLCAPGTVEECPAGLTKCSIGGKGVCAPDLPHDKKFGLDACLAFKAVCSKPGLLFAQSCAKSLNAPAVPGTAA